MQDIATRLSGLNRPRLLAHTAKLAAEAYHRERHLTPFLKSSRLPSHGAAILELMEVEQQQNAMRQRADLDYSLTDHINVLAAIIGEARHWHDARANERQVSKR